MAITKIILQQMVTMDQNSITASKYPKYTVVLSNSISSITAGELTAAIESSKASAAAAKQSEINAKQSELNAKDSENEAEISAASSQQSATQAAASATASANSAKAAKTSETNAKASETAAKTSETNAKASETAAKTSETNANSSKTAAAASASAAKTSETNAAASASAAKISETNAKTSETNAANSAKAAKTSETNAKTSETNAAASAARAESVASNMKGTIGLGDSPRDCPDISGNPSAFIGFMRIREGVPGWPPIASGEAFLTGFISVRDGTPTYSGVFVGWATRSLYTYGWSPQSGPQWTRHARKDEVDRLVQGSGESALWGAGRKQKFVLWDAGTGETMDWGVYDNAGSKWVPLGVGRGGTGATTAAGARANLQLNRFQRSSDTRTIVCSTDIQAEGCYLQVDANGQWGAFNPIAGSWQPLAIAQGGTGARDYNSALTNLNAMRDQKADLSGTDLNMLDGTKAGFYHQGANAGATSANHFPVNSAGALLVMQNNANGPQGGTQLYFPYNSINGSFYMRQYIKQSSTTGWEWTEWKIFQSYDWTSTPQFYGLNLVRTSDANQVAGGILQCILNDGAGSQRTRLRVYPEFRGDNRGWATLHLQTGDKNQYLGMDEDGNVATNGKFIGFSAELRSNVNNPLTLTSQHPTIRFDESDRPSDSPYYSFIFDGGNWRIQKDGTGYNGEYVIGYTYRNDQIDLPNVRANFLTVPPAKLQQTKDSLLIPNTGLSNWSSYNAPAGAEASKYYPVIISHPAGFNGDRFIEVSMRTRSLSGNQNPNCNMVHLWIRDAGWSDMGQDAFGSFHAYDAAEVAILCVRGTEKGQYPHNAIYVRGDAFPIVLASTIGSTITIPTTDWTIDPSASDKAIYKWGITTATDGLESSYGTNNLLNFSKGRRGFYSTSSFSDSLGNKYLKDQMTDGGTITLAIENLVNNGKIIANKSFISQGDLTDERSFISKRTDDGITQTLDQSEFRAGERNAQIVVRDLSSTANHMFFNFNLDGTFSAPSGMVTHTGADWNTQQSDIVNKFKPLAGSVNAPSSGLTYAGMHIGYSGTNYGQIAIGYDNIYFRNNGSGGTNKWIKLARIQEHNTFENTVYFGDLVRFYDRNLSKNLEIKSAGTSDNSAQIELWGNLTGRPTVVELKATGLSGGGSKWLNYSQYNTDASVLFAVNGGINCTTVNQSSDRELKDQLEVIPDATAALRKMNGYTYILKENGLPYAGVIAQEVMEALPEAVGSFNYYGEELVGPTKDGSVLREEKRFLNVDYAAVTGLLVQVNRESDNRITTLESEVSDLKKQIADLTLVVNSLLANR